MTTGKPKRSEFGSPATFFLFSRLISKESPSLIDSPRLDGESARATLEKGSFGLRKGEIGMDLSQQLGLFAREPADQSANQRKYQTREDGDQEASSHKALGLHVTK